MLSRRRLLVLAGAIALAGGALAVALAAADDDPAGTIAKLPERVFAKKTVALSLRASLRSPSGELRYTDSTATLDLEEDRAFVDLPEVLRNDTLELVSQGRSLYITVPPDREADFPGIRWLSIATRGRAEARGARVGPVPDPTTVLLSLAGAAGEPRPLGTRELDDVKMRVLRVPVEPRLVAERMGADHVASANRLGGISLRWTAEVWLDTGDLPRRVQLSADVDEAGQPAGTLVLDLRVGDFDQPVTIGIPPRDAVRPVASVEEALALLGTG